MRKNVLFVQSTSRTLVLLMKSGTFSVVYIVEVLTVFKESISSVRISQDAFLLGNEEEGQEEEEVEEEAEAEVEAEPSDRIPFSNINTGLSFSARTFTLTSP